MRILIVMLAIIVNVNSIFSSQRNSEKYGLIVGQRLGTIESPSDDQVAKMISYTDSKGQIYYPCPFDKLTPDLVWQVREQAKEYLDSIAFNNSERKKVLEELYLMRLWLEKHRGN